jgi:hypothetical protein
MAAGAQHALENRFDLMNQRSIAVDAWRQLAIIQGEGLEHSEIGGPKPPRFCAKSR